ncbi:MAG: M73 family metallopeptidase [Clostridiales bacterium]|jgi:predicted ribosomally synthesized peptide with SipW-like signal peptide|nr:M73 family metallopeptidase [Clostridiales bacterium]
MLKNKIVILGAVAVLAVSLIGGATYAWFSAQASAKVGGLAGDGNGVDGGLVAGHVDLLLDVDSYTIVDGNRQPVGTSPYIIYPGDVVDFDGKSLDDVQSVLEYKLTNTSGTAVVARLDQRGLTVEKGTNTTSYGITQTYLDVRQLLGYNNQESATANTWFYFAKKPSGGNDPYRYVDIQKLTSYSFKKYDISQVAVAASANGVMNGKKFYAPKRTLPLFKTGTHIGVTATSDIIISNNPELPNDEVTIFTLDKDTDKALTYLKMPSGTSVTFKLILEVDPQGEEDENTEAIIGDNAYQYAVYTLALLDEDQEDPDNLKDLKLYAYGTQTKEAAVDQFYGTGIFGRLQTGLGLK